MKSPARQARTVSTDFTDESRWNSAGYQSAVNSRLVGNSEVEVPQSLNLRFARFQDADPVLGNGGRW